MCHPALLCPALLAGSLHSAEATLVACKPVSTNVCVTVLMLAVTLAATGAASRAHLEANIAAALALQSAADYRRWLLTYARHLSGVVTHADTAWTLARPHLRQECVVGSAWHDTRRLQPTRASLLQFLSRRCHPDLQPQRMNRGCGNCAASCSALREPLVPAELQRRQQPAQARSMTAALTGRLGSGSRMQPPPAGSRRYWASTSGSYCGRRCCVFPSSSPTVHILPVTPCLLPMTTTDSSSTSCVKLHPGTLLRCSGFCTARSVAEHVEFVTLQVLRDIGRNRANQRLVNEFTELLSRVA